MTQSAAGKFIA